MAVHPTWARKLLETARYGSPWRIILLGDYDFDDGDYEYLSQIQNFEAAGIGVSRPAVGDLWVALDQDTGAIGLYCNPIEFGVMSTEISSVQVYADTGTASTSPLVTRDLFDEPVTVDGRNFVYEPQATGLISLVME